jgi:lipopolysaccharide export system protein LptA
MLLLSLIFPAAASPQATQKNSQKVEREPTVITSDTLEVDNKREMIIFTGHVDARREDMIISCQKMLVYYHNQPGDRAS